MNPATVELLRAATIQALQSKEDAAATELMALMNGTAVESAPKALPEAKTTQLAIAPETVDQIVSDGPAHDYHYWVAFIRHQFIPFMSSHGRLRFSSHELLTWLENRPDLNLTTGDVERNSQDKLIWRHSVSAALGNLKTQGVLAAPPFGKEYTITQRIEAA